MSDWRGCQGDLRIKTQVYLPDSEALLQAADRTFSQIEVTLIPSKQKRMRPELV